MLEVLLLSMKQERRTLEVLWEYDSAPDAAERLLRAFEMLLNKMPVAADPQSEDLTDNHSRGSMSHAKHQPESRQ